MNDNGCFVVWVRRSTESIFGSASYAVNRNGSLLAFRDEDEATLQCDQLNAHRGSDQIHYSVERLVRATGGGDDEDILDLTPDLEVSAIADLAA